MAKTSKPTLVWFRQDLRLVDQGALAAAADEGPVVGCYILDDENPGHWRIGGAQRWWLHQSLKSLTDALAAYGVPLVLRRGSAATQVARLAKEIGAARVHCLRHYEPWWTMAEEALAEQVELVRHPGYLLAAPDMVSTGSGGRFRIFTPFWRALLQQMPPPRPQPVPRSLAGPAKAPKSDSLASWALQPTRPDWAAGFHIWTPGEDGANAVLRDFVDRVRDYDHDRNLPSIEGSSRLSPHLHMGEISPAAVWHGVATETGPQSFLRELGWRDFASNLIDQRGDYGDENGRSALNGLAWRCGKAADTDFRKWTAGLTGYPIVDAGMRQLWTTGWMHNRVRMIAASFVVKHLLIDWRRGARWYWDTLVDADYGNNSVNWQWIAGTGVDSNPFGRIMAPLLQSEKFDAANYIREWVPELAKLDNSIIHAPHLHGVVPADYPEPLIGHREGRERALATAARLRKSRGTLAPSHD